MCWRGVGSVKLGLAYFHGYDQEKVNVQKQLGLCEVISGSREMDGYAPYTMAVSYTHLDVYKRQYWDGSFEPSFFRIVNFVNVSKL